MASQLSIEHASFLDACINKKRTLQDIYEALGLYSETSGARKEPVFVKTEANDLHNSIKQLAKTFNTSQRNNRGDFSAVLVKSNTFADEVRELGFRYGPTLWGKSESWSTQYGRDEGALHDELDWNTEIDRAS
jgi:hypothetical protein